eukprot:g3410.t1
MFPHATDGALVKRAKLRFWHRGGTDAGQRVSLCELETDLLAHLPELQRREETDFGRWADSPAAAQGGANRCVTVVEPGPGWIEFDVTGMVRRMITFPERNMGFWLRASGGQDTVDLATPLTDEVGLRPRLAVSCHGDGGGGGDAIL